MFLSAIPLLYTDSNNIYSIPLYEQESLKNIAYNQGNELYEGVISKSALLEETLDNLENENIILNDSLEEEKE